MAREFTEITEVCEYFNDYKNYLCQNLEVKDYSDIAFIQKSGLRPEYGNDEFQNKCIKALNKAIDYVMPLEESIILYRAGNMLVKKRPYYSSAFFRESAEKYLPKKSKKVHRIIVHAGAKILPFAILGTEDSEGEVILDTRKVIWLFGWHYLK